MELGLLLGWLSIVQWRRSKYRLVLPDMPALGKPCQFSNEFRWNAEMLEKASGLRYADYVNGLDTPCAVPGTCPLNPIVLEDDVTDEPSSTSYYTSDSPSLRNDRGPDSCSELPGFVAESVGECDDVEVDTSPDNEENTFNNVRVNHRLQ
ncbi:hypothetical protein M758_UG312300 [Ceratodon purpureus]|nr:hypothetical protein M758_UG312300 [Ceratodon purpureus]